MQHIVFQQADIAGLQKAIELDESLAGEVIEIKDEFAVGPIADIYEAQGYQQRRDWWKEILQFSPYVESLEIVDDRLTVHKLIQNLKEDNALQVWIWMAQNQHDVCGYYWLISQLKDFQGRIFILYLNNLPFINEKGHLFYPTNIFEIQPKEFLKAKKLARQITPSEIEVDPDEWIKLCNEEKGVRTLEGGKKLLQHDYDYYDDELLKFISADWQKVNKLFHSFFSKSKNTTGDAYLLWRLKLMITQNKIDIQGEVKGLKDFEVKLKVTEAITE
jgi:hypothetical protein